MATYQEFRELGDQWLISYACNIANTPAQTLFVVGHCLEAYCKAAILKNDSTVNIADKKYGHNIGFMIGEIQRDIGILTSLSFRPGVESKFMTGGPIPIGLSADPDYAHYVANQELYWVAKFQKDIKYLGTTGGKMPTQYSIMVMNRNSYWLPIIKEINRYISDQPPFNFSVDVFLRDRNIPDAFKIYVREAKS
jgi:hypothetical protein